MGLVFSFPVLFLRMNTNLICRKSKMRSKKSLTASGVFFELKPVLFGLDRDSAFYKIKFYDKDEGSTLEQYNSGLRLEGSYHKGIADLFLEPIVAFGTAMRGGTGIRPCWKGIWPLKPDPGFALEAGKKVLLWGKAMRSIP